MNTTSSTAPPRTVPSAPPMPVTGPPDELCCSITQELFDDPVILVEGGQTYSRAALMEWFRTCDHPGPNQSPRPRTSPLTGLRIRSSQVVPDYQKRAAVAAYTAALAGTSTPAAPTATAPATPQAADTFVSVQTYVDLLAAHRANFAALPKVEAGTKVGRRTALVWGMGALVAPCVMGVSVGVGMGIAAGLFAAGLLLGQALAYAARRKVNRSPSGQAATQALEEMKRAFADPAKRRGADRQVYKEIGREIDWTNGFFAQSKGLLGYALVGALLVAPFIVLHLAMASSGAQADEASVPHCSHSSHPYRPAAQTNLFIFDSPYSNPFFYGGRPYSRVLPSSASPEMGGTAPGRSSTASLDGSAMASVAMRPAWRAALEGASF
jgi:hypothetical protein